MRQQVASAVNLVVQITRLSDGTRRVTAISEITGMEQDVITMQDIFLFERTGLHAGRPGQRACSRPPASGRSARSSWPAAGFTMSPEMFEHRHGGGSRGADVMTFAVRDVRRSSLGVIFGAYWLLILRPESGRAVDGGRPPARATRRVSQGGEHR